MRTATRTDYLRGLNRVLTHVMDHLDEPLQPGELADLAGFSRHHFHRVFRGMMRESIGEFVRRLRLERAALLLADGRPVGEVALACGWESHEAFTRAFREAFGRPPSEWRTPQHLRLPAPNGVHYQPGEPVPIPRLPMENTPMNVEIKEAPALRAVCMRHRGPYWQIGPVFGQLTEWAVRTGVPMNKTVAFYHDNPEETPEADLRSDAGILVGPDYQTDDPAVHVIEVPANTYAIFHHKGSYEELPTAWNDFIGKWFPASGHAMGEGLCFELYVTTCEVAGDQAETDLYQPVAKPG